MTEMSPQLSELVSSPPPSDAILALADQPTSDMARSLFGDELGYVEYVMPGFILAKKVAEVFDANPKVKGASPLLLVTSPIPSSSPPPPLPRPYFSKGSSCALPPPLSLSSLLSPLEFPPFSSPSPPLHNHLRRSFLSQARPLHLC